MNPSDDRLRLDLAAARYQEAMEREDFDTMAEVWQLALAEPELESALRDVHAGLLEEQALEATATAEVALTAAVESHLPSADIVRPGAGPVTVGDVANELFRRAPDRLPAAAHLLNEQLRSSLEPLPPDLGLSKLTAWAEATFGAGPAEYWKAFRQAAVKLELRRAAEREYRLAARQTPPSEDRP
jgi:hypothetical protein